MVKDLLEEDMDGMLFTSAMNLLELLDLILKISIDLLKDRQCRLEGGE